MPELLHVFEPRGGCKAVMEAREAEVLISGPAGTGKSRACLEKLHMAMLLTPGSKSLILRKTQKSLGSSALDTWKKFVVTEAMAVDDVVYYGGSQAEPAQYRYKNGSRVVIGGLDNPMKVMSTEYDMIYIQEATEITLTDLEMCKTRLRNWRMSFQQLLMDCNPAGDKHWLKLRCNDGKTRMIESRHEDNPRLFGECTADAVGALPYEASSTGYIRLTKQGAEYIAILDSLTGVRYKRLRKGLWVSAEGIIYEDFDPAIHVIDKMPLGWEMWERYWVIDFGFKHPFVLQCYAMDYDGVLYLYREIYHTERTVAEHAKTILGIVTQEVIERPGYYDHINDREVPPLLGEPKWLEPMPVQIICDHDTQARITFEKETGLGTQAADKDVVAGINLHQERLKQKRWFMLRDCVVERDQSLVDQLLPASTEEEYASYVWKKHTATEKYLDEPHKFDDHGMDAARYLTMEFDLHGPAGLRFMS